MKQLSKQQAQTLLEPVPYSQWLSAGRMLMPSGIHKHLLGSLSEVHWFLEPTSKSLPSIDFDRLADWLETTIKDKHIAGEVRHTAEVSSSYVETCKMVYELVGARISEAEEVLNNAHS